MSDNQNTGLLMDAIKGNGAAEVNLLVSLTVISILSTALYAMFAEVLIKLLEQLVFLVSALLMLFRAAMLLYPVSFLSAAATFVRQLLVRVTRISSLPLIRPILFRVQLISLIPLLNAVLLLLITLLSNRLVILQKL